jgi:LacI family transcriptional regulator
MQPSSAWLTHLLDMMFEEEYDLMLQTYYPSFPLSRRKLAELVSGRRFDGCISTPPCEADGFIVDLFATYKIPLVQINPLAITPSLETNQHFVIADDKKGASLAVSHLINLGHRKIAFLRGPRNMRAAFDRFSGFCETMTNAGLSIIDQYQVDTEFTFDGGYTAAKMVMQLSDPPTAIYAANDEVAQGVLFAAQELGLDIPGDLSICGHDNLLSSARTWPGITTIHQPIDELLENALHLLISILKKEDTNIAPLVLTPRIIVRGSTVPYKQRN